MASQNKKAVVDMYDEYAGVYKDVLALAKYAVPSFLEKHFPKSLPHKVLDLACGPGNLTAQMAEYSRESQFYGIDISPNMIAEAEKLQLYKELEVGDLDSGIPFGDISFDLICSFGALEFINDLDALFAIISSRLKPESYFLFSIEEDLKLASENTPFEPNERGFYHYSYTKEKIEEMLQAAKMELIESESTIGYIRPQQNKQIPYLLCKAILR